METLHSIDLLRQPRHKWFSAPDLESEEWCGPHDTIEMAAMECWGEYGTEHQVYIAQGRKLTKFEIAEMGVEYTWEVDDKYAFLITVVQRRDWP